MEFITKVSFLILFLLNEQTPCSSAEWAEDYDITDPLNETIVGILRSVEPINVLILIRTIENRQALDAGSFTREGVTAALDNIQITKVHSEATRISYIFQERLIHIHNPQFTVHLNGRVKSENCSQKIWVFGAIMHFRNYSITAVRGSDQLVNISCQFSNLSIDIRETTEFFKIQLHTTLLPKYEEILPEILLKNMRYNAKFIQSLNNIYDYLLKTPIISKHDDFLTHENHYYYLIPTRNFAGYTVKNFTIKGLSNFYSVNFNENPLTYILQINHIQGSVILLNQSEAEGSISQLNFNFDSLTISVSWETNRIQVAAQNYTVNNTKLLKNLDELHAAAIVEILDASIAFSIMPSMELQGITAETPPQQLLVEETTTTTTEQLPTPFKQLPQNSSTTGENLTTLLHTTPEPLDYHISFNDVQIKLITSDQSYPQQVQCELLNKLKYAQNINVLPYGKNNSADRTAIKFNANVSSINISVIQSNNSSKDNNSCHFQIHVNQIIDVTSSPSISTMNSVKRSLQHSEIKKKIEAVLTAMVKERDRVVQIVTPIVKPIVCSSLNVCLQSAKAVDAFFSRFVDNVLKRCSLRRNPVLP